MIVPLTIYLLERAVRLVLSHVRNTELIDVKLTGGASKVSRSGRFHYSLAVVHLDDPSGLREL